jgi:hypothetical protein
MRQTYVARLRHGEDVVFSADLAQASAPILLINDDGEPVGTPYCTADARHDDWNAAELVSNWQSSEDDDVEVRRVEALEDGQP